VSNIVKILDREYSFIPSDKGLNYIIANEFKEIFIDIFEISCNNNKLIAEKVDSINGDPVIKIATQFEGKEYSPLFVVRQGDDNIILNIKSLNNGRNIYVTEKALVEEITKEIELPELTQTIVENTTYAPQSITVDIDRYKSDAIRVINENFVQKKQSIEQLEDSLKTLINDRLTHLNDVTTTNILEKVKESLDANQIDKDLTLAEINSIRDNIITTVELYNNSINQTAEEKTTQLQELQEKVKYEVDVKLAELEVETKSQLQHISEAYDSIKTFIATTKEEFLNDKTSNAATIEKLFEVAKLTVESNIKRAENLVGKKLSNLQSITDKKVNDITSIIESKISYFDEKAQQLQTNVDEFNSVLSQQVEKAIDQIAVESQDKLIDFDRTKEEISQLVVSNTTELQNLKTQFTEAIDKKIRDIKSVAISKEDLNQLKKQFESRFETESANIKKYVASYGGGGGNGGGGGTGGNQTLSFNETTAALSISNGNTVSLSSLGEGGGGSADKLVNGSYQVVLCGNGDLTFPGGGYIGTQYGGTGWLVTPAAAGGIASADGEQYIQINNGQGIFIGTNWPSSAHEWTFGRDGGLTFPDGTIQTTAFTDTLSALTVTGNANIAGTLSATTLYATSAYITVIDITQYELSGFNVTGNFTINGILSSSQIIYASGGNSNQWNSVYATVQSNSATTWNYQGTDIKELTGNWQSTYTSFNAQSGNYATLAANTFTGIQTLTSGTASAPALRFAGAGNNTGIYSSGANTIDFAINGSRRIYIDFNGTLNTNGSSIQVNSGNLIATNTYLRQDGPTLRFGASDDVAIGRDGAAETLALGRRNTAANAFRVYNNYISATNYERFTIDWQTNPNTCVIATSAGSVGGVTRGMEFRVGSTTAMSILSSGTIQTNQDIEITDSTKGIILKSPSNFKYRVTVNDAGELITTLI
jgi:hypothetical protein